MRSGRARSAPWCPRRRCRRSAPWPPICVGARDGRRSSTRPPGHGSDESESPHRRSGARSDRAAAGRATSKGPAQRVGADVACGGGGFAEDTAPADALVAVPDGRGGSWWAPRSAKARALAERVPGRNSTVALRHPLEIPPGALGSHACGRPSSSRATSSPTRRGASPAVSRARRWPTAELRRQGVLPGGRRWPALGRETGRAVRVVFSREDVVRYGPKRPPIAAGVRRDGSGVMRWRAPRAHRASTAG